MEIHFTKSEYGICGGGLDKPFTHLCSMLLDRFQTENITFPYLEIEIQLAFRAPKVKEARYLEWYGKLPTYYRGNNMVRIILPMAERVKTLADVFELFYKAFDILTSKKKKSDFVDEQKIKSVLLDLEQELQARDLWELHRHYEALLRQKSIERNRQGQIIREQTPAEKERLIHDLRF